MVRAPCCEKMGLKKGPWTSEEDMILITYINRNGHGNWRALPKQAGLLRCGKSCRLRWMNYLRPDIKRGNFTLEEEEQIIRLHQELGNKWSVIAARLPGRTDNEIKNVWHTHLKKTLNKKSQNPKPETHIHITPESPVSELDKSSEPYSPLHSSPSEGSSLSTAVPHTTTMDSFENLVEMDETFWSDVLSGPDDSGATSDFSSGNSDSRIQFSDSFGFDSNTENDMDFWYNLFHKAEDLVHLPEF